MITNKQLFQWTTKIFRMIRARKYHNLRLPSQEWEDIHSKATIRAFRSLKFYRKERGDLFNYIYVVVYNTMKNGIRDFMANPKFQSIFTKIKSVDVFGDEILLYEPDMVDEQGYKANLFEGVATDLLNHFLEKLTAFELILFKEFCTGKSRTQIAEDNNITLAKVDNNKVKIKIKFKESLLFEKSS